jgi:hypothetical protein
MEKILCFTKKNEKINNYGFILKKLFNIAKKFV